MNTVSEYYDGALLSTHAWGIGNTIAAIDLFGNGTSPVYYDDININVAIPAPGAMLLGSIGVGLVGWLRRRRTV